MTPSVPLFNCLKWLPFYEEAKVTRCAFAYKKVRGDLPSYLKELLKLNSSLHGRSTRYWNYNLLCSSYKRQTEAGRTFAVQTCQTWNGLPLDLRRKESLNSFQHSLRNKIFSEQQFIAHFLVSNTFHYIFFIIITSFIMYCNLVGHRFVSFSWLFSATLIK